MRMICDELEEKLNLLFLLIPQGDFLVQIIRDLPPCYASMEDVGLCVRICYGVTIKVSIK